MVELFKLQIEEVDEDEEVGEWAEDDELDEVIVEPEDDIVKSIDDEQEFICDLESGWIEDGLINSVSSFFLNCWFECDTVDDVDTTGDGVKQLLLLLCDNSLEIIFLTLVCSELFTIGNSISLFLISIRLMSLFVDCDM